MYKRFEAETLKTAHMKVKLDLGPDAIILSQREVRKSGLPGILGKKVWQVVAYCPAQSEKRPDPAKPKPEAPATAVMDAQSQKQPGRPKPKVRNPVNHLIDEPALPFSEFVPERPAEPGRRGPGEISLTMPAKKKIASAYDIPTSFRNPAVRPAGSADFAGGMEISAIRILMKEVRAISDKLSAPPAPAAAGDQVILPGVLPALYQRLILQEVPRETAVDMMNALCDRTTLDMNSDTATIEALEEQLAGLIATVSLEELVSNRRPRMVFLVGPAGVGKTTTLAKVATLSSRDEKMRIAFITIDTLRVAAAEQLKSYADLISADIEIVMSEEDFVSAASRHAEKDLILVDTPGKNPCSPSALADFSGYLKRLTAARQPPPAVLLVLSATTKLADLQRYVACYQSLNPAGIVFTKMDETSTYGTVLPVLEAAKLPMVFLTCGQEVPEDIEPANGRRMARRILGP